jgi:hypothetical protein
MTAIGIEVLFDMLDIPRGTPMDMLTHEFAARPALIRRAVDQHQGWIEESLGVPLAEVVILKCDISLVDAAIPQLLGNIDCRGSNENATHMHMDHCGGLLVDEVRERLRPDLRIHVAAFESKFWGGRPDFSRVHMPPGFPDALQRTAKRFLNEYDSRLRPFEKEYEVAPGVLVQRTGGHTPGHSVVRLASGGDRLTFAGDLVFQTGFEHPDWYNGFEHDPEEAALVRVGLLRELAANRESLVATHLSFPSVCHVAVDGDVFRWVPSPWEY